MPYNSTHRQEIVNKLSENTYDILVVGGGITGAGIALDAATRGFTVALVEMQDFAAGTSSRSTKLVHGGLRYLKNLELDIVRETGLERAVVYRNAPHLVRPEKMLLPLTKDGSYGKWSTSFGLWLYDVLAGVKGADKRKMLDRQQTLEREPLLRDEEIIGSGYYAEYRTDDARLTIEVLKTATDKGATALNYLQVDSLTYSKDRVVGADCIDILTNEKLQISADFVVNATGPWVDLMRAQDTSLNEKRIHLTKGVHLVVAHERLPIGQSIYFDVADGRMIFAIPREGKTYIGTTDTNYQGDKANPKITKADVDYLLKAVNAMFPTITLQISDVESSWAGLRPLIHEEGKDPSEISRGDEVFESDSGLITIAGGKLTGYRLMAKKVLRLICDRKRIIRKCRTRRTRLTGGFKKPKELPIYLKEVERKLKEAKLDGAKAFYLVHRYGKQSDQILHLYKEKQFTYLVQAEAYFTIQQEGVVCLEDFFARRTSKLLFDRHKVMEQADQVMSVFAELLGWQVTRQEEERIKLKILMKEALAFD
jgi:glycerol-3-phosphate dehydrogenase